VADARPTIGHLVADAALAAVSLVAAARGLRPLDALAHQPAEGAAVALVSSVTAGLVVLALSVLPTVVQA
jgi:hypothetical protein